MLELQVRCCSVSRVAGETGALLEKRLLLRVRDPNFMAVYVLELCCWGVLREI